jgi:hypothetical protein
LKVLKRELKVKGWNVEGCEELKVGKLKVQNNLLTFNPSYHII